jgi:hypothetical protein
MTSETTKTPILEDGIYFGIDRDLYHAQPRFSASGICDMLVSPATYWSRSWMNPDREAMDRSTPAAIAGTAYHCAMLEPERYEREYYPELTREDMPEGSLFTGPELTEALGARGMTKTVKGEGVMGQAQRLADAGFPVSKLWHIRQAAWELEHEGMTALPAELVKSIRRDMTRLHGTPEVAELIGNGYSEVAVLWTDPGTGIRFKVLMDKMTLRGVIDLKTFENFRRRPLEICLRDKVRYDRLYVQASLYWEAFELVRTGMIGAIDPDPDQVEFLEELRKPDRRGEFWWLFMERGGVPNFVGRQFLAMDLDASMKAAAPSDEAADQAAQKFAGATMLYQKARAEIDYACRELLRHMEMFGTKPWLPIIALDRFTDDHFSPYWLNGDD